jgi:hypothetical protein
VSGPLNSEKPSGSDVLFVGGILPSAGPPGYRKRETYLNAPFFKTVPSLDLSSRGSGRDYLYWAATELCGCGARIAAGSSFFLPRNSRIGEAMKIDDEVPMMTPKMIASAKPRITSPPISANGRIERITVSDVATVRPRSD